MKHVSAGVLVRRAGDLRLDEKPPRIWGSSRCWEDSVSAKMENVDQLAKRIQRAIPKTPGGSLRFWGAWFGRPYDAFHTIVKCEAEKGVLRVFFNEGETLSVWSPSGLTINSSTFRNSHADCVRWGVVLLWSTADAGKSSVRGLRKGRTRNRNLHQCRMVHFAIPIP